MYKVTFNNKNSVFYSALKTEVEKYFRDKKIKKTGNWELFLKTAILVTAATSLYVFLLTVPQTLIGGILLCALLGFVLASIGFNIMHDACHGSYSSKKWVNNLMGHSLNALGGNAFIWKFKHNIIHHTYTNIDGVDDDIAKSPLMRQCPTQKWVPAHRFQHFYVVLVYAISSFAWVTMMDFNKYFKQKVFTTPLQRMKRQDHIIFWVSKVLYALFYVVIPVMLVGWQTWAIGFAAMHLTLGLTLALTFQLAHVVEHAQFEIATLDPKLIDNEWAIHQVRTTANFAPRNHFINWYVGGLNFQIEHHLFPRVSHVHYPAISKIVKRVCEEHNINYNQFPTMWGALASHFRMMKQLGQKPQQLSAVA
jgi:linoleoyl-CoA desaturase